MRSILRSFLFSLPAVALYYVALPWAALRLDRWWGLVWRLPFWMEPVAAVAALAGTVVAVWSFWALTVRGKGTPNPLAPPTELVAAGPFRRSRNPLMLGGWLYGAGAACLLRSPCLLGLVALIVSGGAVYVRWIEEPRLRARFGAAYAQYASRTPRWLVPLVVLVLTAAALPALTVDHSVAPGTEPAILVQIRCKPGTAELWRADFDQHILPAIQEVIARGDSYTGFQFLKSALPFQTFDFVLIYTGKTFSGLDEPRPFPHYIALFQREGTVRAVAVLKEMGAYEDQVSVTLSHASKVR